MYTCTERSVNVLRVAERRNRIEPAASRKFLLLLGALPIEVASSSDVLDDMMTLYRTAEESSLTAKDKELNTAARLAGIKLV